MSLIVCPECGQKFSDKAVACPHCGCPTGKQAAVPALARAEEPAVLDTVPREKVIQHLRYAAELEQAVFTYDRACDGLTSKISGLGLRRSIKPPEAPDCTATFVSMMYTMPVFAAILLFIFLLSGGHFWSELLCILSVVLIFFSGEVFCKVLGALAFGTLISAVIGLISVIVEVSNFNKAKNAHQEALNADGRRVANEQRLAQKLIKQRSEILDKTIETQMQLDALYDLNIIFPKYRNMVAVVTMLEYLESGRCTGLTGPHGAYDTFSTEEKQNAIIGKLDIVIDRLDEIRNSQYMLYDAIQEANSTASEICYQADRLIETNGKIAENAALAAYNSEIIRRNTEVSAYVDAFYRT